MTGFAKSILFLSSYAPLFAILSIKYYPIDKGVALGSLMVLGISLILFAGLMIYLHRNASPINVKVKAVARRDGELLSYAITYFLPFLSLDLSEIYDLISFLLLYAVIWLAYVRANAIHINPLFHICGYRLFEVEDADSGRSITVITPDPFIHPGETIQVQMETSRSIGLKV